MNRENNMSSFELKQMTEIPQYGVKLKFNHVFPEKRTQNVRPTLRQSLPLLALAYRYTNGRVLHTAIGGSWFSIVDRFSCIFRKEKKL